MMIARDYFFSAENFAEIVEQFVKFCSKIFQILWLMACCHWLN